ncbi:MAG: hypothetical protein HZA24_04175 [Nitrospirae bacterium]|nr:hypothetical protein [Nitrospirota bacterium]
MKTEEWWTDRLECFQAVEPVYSQYEIDARELLAGGVFPVWRVDGARRAVVGDPNAPRAFAISFQELAALPELIAQPPIGFDQSVDYYKKNNRIAIAHCDACGVRIVKDGNRRLLQSACRQTNERLFVYEATSGDWSPCRADMRHFCRCGGAAPRAR